MRLADQYIGFISEATLLLFVPGPTNTLLAARGALLGIPSALGGVLAETFGYALTITALRLFLEPITAHVPAIQVFVKVFCASYLIVVAYQLWMGEQKGDRNSVSCGRIFVTTMINPKAFLFAFVILPKPTTDILRLNVVHGLILVAIMMVAGAIWTTIGALASTVAPSKAPLAIGRAASLVLVSFSLYIFFNVVNATLSSHGAAAVR
jgi:threonine/homoserine/homoserine lactone efflux protein